MKKEQLTQLKKLFLDKERFVDITNGLMPYEDSIC